MQRYLVTIREEFTRTYTIPVDAASEAEAKKAALGMALASDFTMPEPDSTDYGDIEPVSVVLAEPEGERA
jgi:hypothetical protein